MNLLQRLSIAYQVLRGTTRKDAPYLWPVFQGGQAMWHMDNFRTYTAEGYDMNGVIHSAIRYKARTLGGGRLRAYSGDLDSPEPLPMTHPLAQLLARPNAWQSWREFQEQRITYLNLAGNSYTWLDRPTRGGIPRALYNLRPDRVYIVPNERSLMGYLYVPDDRSVLNGVPFLPEDVIHVKFPNPLDRFEGLGYGLSPLAPMAQSGDVDNQVTRYLKIFFERGGMPPGVLKSTLPLSDDEVARNRARWQEVYGGTDNWTDVLVLDSGLEYQRLDLSFDKMGFEAMDARNETRILGPFGVPPILIGIRIGLQRSTFSNAKEAREACWEDTLSPEQDLFLSDDSFYLGQPDEGIFLNYDNSSIPAMQQDKPALITAAKDLWSMGVPANESFRIVGLKVSPFPGGDVSYVPSLVAPVGTEAAPAPETARGTPNAEDDPPPKAASDPKAARSSKAQGWNEDDKARLWQAADDLAVSHEQAFRDEAGRQFDRDKREILALVGEMKRKSLARKAAVQWE
jgi:HK97 family phage portal protein